MKKITLGEFEDAAGEMISSGMKGVYFSKEQEWFDPDCDMTLKFCFDQLMVIHSPRRIVMKNGESYIQLMFINDIMEFPEENETIYRIHCGAEKEKQKSCTIKICRKYQ